LDVFEMLRWALLTRGLATQVRILSAEPVRFSCYRLQHQIHFTRIKSLFPVTAEDKTHPFIVAHITSDMISFCQCGIMGFVRPLYLISAAYPPYAYSAAGHEA